MRINAFEGHTVGEIEHGIPFPARHKKPLSIEQKQLLQLKDGERLVLAAHFSAFLNENAERLIK